ncbi:hypothetical protein [Bacillus sp. PS06]|uniref:hypothetical protein n=1 Tax=Bacillus sp. PS06 TaxID=2764176 RepID=UPI0017860BA9|nr:hypothetical protein [Bacillus sp. PS06]MBD8071281.1 hypothetical protein [Bacillus sp. PS06]
MEGVPVFRLSDWLTTSSVSVISLKTLYRWKHQFQDFWGSWWIEQRKRLVFDFQEGDGVLSVYRGGMSSNEELQLLLTFFFGKNTQVPCKGRLFSMLNLRQPFSIRKDS